MNKDERMKVTNTDLLANRNKYSIDILEKNIEHLDDAVFLFIIPFLSSLYNIYYCTKYYNIYRTGTL